MLSLIAAALLFADAEPTPGCLNDALQRAKEIGTKKLLALDTLCPAESIDVEGRLCGTAFVVRMRACGHSYLCTIPDAGPTSCRPALIETPKTK